MICHKPKERGSKWSTIRSMASPLRMPKARAASVIISAVLGLTDTVSSTLRCSGAMLLRPAPSLDPPRLSDIINPSRFLAV